MKPTLHSRARTGCVTRGTILSVCGWPTESKAQNKGLALAVRLKYDTMLTPHKTAMREQFIELIKKARTASPTGKLQIEVTEKAFRGPRLSQQLCVSSGS